MGYEGAEGNPRDNLGVRKKKLWGVAYISLENRPEGKLGLVSRGFPME